MNKVSPKIAIAAQEARDERASQVAVKWSIRYKDGTREGVFVAYGDTRQDAIKNIQRITKGRKNVDAIEVVK